MEKVESCVRRSSHQNVTQESKSSSHSFIDDLKAKYSLVLMERVEIPTIHYSIYVGYFLVIKFYSYFSFFNANSKSFM